MLAKANKQGLSFLDSPPLFYLFILFTIQSFFFVRFKKTILGIISLAQNSSECTSIK